MLHLRPAPRCRARAWPAPWSICAPGGATSVPSSRGRADGRRAAPRKRGPSGSRGRTLTSPEAIAADGEGRPTPAASTPCWCRCAGVAMRISRSTLEPRAAELAARPAFDPLATTLDLAHAAGMQVHAWVAVNLVSSAVGLPASRDHVVYRSPEWLMVPRELAAEMRRMDVRSPAYLGRLARWTRAHASEVEGLYTSPILPEAAAHTAAVIGETGHELRGRRRAPGLRAVSERVRSTTAARPSRQFKASVAADPDRARAARTSRRAKPLDPLAYPIRYRRAGATSAARASRRW